MMVKICGITRREDAQAAVDAGANAIGFIFVKTSPRYIAPERAAVLGRDLPVWKVGIFVDEAASFVENAAHEANLDVIQLYGGDAPLLPSGITQVNFRIPAIRAGSDGRLQFQIEAGAAISDFHYVYVK